MWGLSLCKHKKLNNTIISVTQQPNLGQGHVILEVLDRPVGVLWKSDQLVAETTTCTIHN
jgi:hypothetical protein